MLTSCSVSFSRLELSRGVKAAEEKKFSKAVEHFKRVMARDPESLSAISAAREASKISYFETKNFNDAILFNNHLVKYSDKENERRNAQELIATIYFENLNNYKMAIQEYNKLITLRNSNEEVANYHFNLARSHFYLNNFIEAQSEVEAALKSVEDKDKKFDYLLFLGNVYFNTKRVEAAVKVYEDVVENFPDCAKADNVAMNIIVCYEEMEAFDKAITKLEKLRSSYSDREFIDLKIKRLKERLANLPGSKGLRK